jgi:UDP-N-acetylmuramate dehydrogenase
MPFQPLRDIPLARYTTFQLGGKARYFFEATTQDEIAEAIGWAIDAGIVPHVFGGGSNLVVADSGISGLALRVATLGIFAEDHGKVATIRANAGVVWDDLVRFAVERELSGIECLSGIPGSVGATPIQNIGAYGQEVAETLTRVAVYDRIDRRRLSLERDECEFGYRDSRFKSREPDRYVILGVEIELQRLAPAPIRHGELAASLAAIGRRPPSVQEVRTAVMNLRRKKGMLADLSAGELRSAGSFFVNPVVEADVAAKLVQRVGPEMPIFPQADGRIKLSAGWLIEHAGLPRGQRDGNVGLSPYHCLVLVAHERADAHEVIAFAHRIREAVRERFSIELRPEPNFWGFDPLDHGLPVLDERAPPTLGSPSLPVSGTNS